MTTARALAEQFGLTTADKIKAPAPKPAEPKQRDRWSEDMQREFDRMGWAAVYFAGNEGPEPRYFGDNMGAWPILMGTTESWKDNISRNMDRMSPQVVRRVLFRVWTPTYRHAKQLMALSEAFIRERIDQGVMGHTKLKAPWKDLGPDGDLKKFEADIHALAARNQIASSNDDDTFEEVCREVGKRNARMVERGRAGR